MKYNLILKVMASVVLVAQLAGCFEPSGKNFEGKWIRDVDPSWHPEKLDISCSGGYCEFTSTSWDFVNGGGYGKGVFFKVKIKDEDVLVWDGLPLTAYYKDGKIHHDGNVYVRRE